jgi:hypothetical protein
VTSTELAEHLLKRVVVGLVDSVDFLRHVALETPGSVICVCVNLPRDFSEKLFLK